MARRYTLRERAGYWFDNLMSQGTSSKLRLLLVTTIAYIVVVGLVSAFLTTNKDGGALETELSV